MGERGGDAVLHLAGVFESDPADADGFRHGCEIRVLEIGAEIKKAGGHLLELDEAQRAVVEHHHFQREAVLHQS